MRESQLEFLAELGPLHRVQCAPPDSTQPSLIELKFTEAALRLTAVDVDDTVLVQICAETPEERQEVTDKYPWCDLVGLEITERWLLTNQQGFTDAVQLRFSSTGKGEKILQFTVEASFFRLQIVNELEW
jgi:hypothetical protein